MQKIIITALALIAITSPASAQKPAEPDKFAALEFCALRGQEARFIFHSARAGYEASRKHIAEIEADETERGAWRRAALKDARSQSLYNPALFGRKWEERCVADPKAFGFKP